MRVHKAAHERRLALIEREERDHVARGRRVGLVGGHAAAVGGNEAEVNHGGCSGVRRGVTRKHEALVVERLGLGEHAAVLGHQAVAAVDDVLRGLAPTSAGVGIGADEARARVAHEARAVVGLAHELVGGREVADERGAGKRGRGARRVGHPKVLADLGRDDEARHALALEELGGAEGHLVLAGEGDERDVGGAGAEAPALVELAVGGDVQLGHEAEELAAAQRGGAVVELGGHAHRHAHEHERVNVGRGGGKLGQAVLGGVKQGVLPEEILAGVGRDSELGQHGHLGARARLAHARAGLAHGLGAGHDVVVHVGHANRRGKGRHLDETVAHDVSS